MFVIVQHITDPDAAATDYEARGDHERARSARAFGPGRHLIPGPEFHYRRDAAKAREALRGDTVSGLSFKISNDYDPDWRRQRHAARHALAAQPDGPIAVVNAFNRTYFQWGDHHMITDRGHWSDTAAVNYRNGAYLVVHAIADVHQDGPALRAAAEAGFADRHIPLPTTAEQAVWSVVRALRDTGGDPALVLELIDNGANGDS